MRLPRLSATNQSLTTPPHVAVVVGFIQILVICLLTQPSLGRTAASRQKALEQILDSGQSRAASDDNDDDCDNADGIYHRPHFTKGRSVMVQLFEWKFVDVAEECRTFLGPKRYGGVQLSPVLEHTVIKTDGLNHPWWQRYETVSYRLSSRSGDETDFYSMSRICNDLGVRLYVDVVLNHMAAPPHLLLKNKTTPSPNEDFIVNTLLATDVNISQSSYPDVPYTAKDFHRTCSINLAASNAQEMRNCQLNGHPDLDHSHETVRQAIVTMLNKFIDMGVAGFRIDSAKYVWPIDLKLIYEQLKDLNTEYNFPEKSRPFMYHDVFDMGLDQISKTEYATYGVVTEYLYGAEISTILRGKAPLSSLINWGPAMGFLPHPDSLVFIDSHNTQRGLPPQLGKNRALTYKQRHKYIMANALMLAHPYGRIKRIMSSYYFKNPDQGPPVAEEGEDEIRSPEFNEQQQCTPTSGWVCEHRWPPLVQLVKMANYFSKPGQREESVIHFQTNGPNQIAFCRGQKAFVAMNNDVERDMEMEVYTCLEEGVYCDVVSGGLKKGGQECRGRSLEVNADGFAKLNLPGPSEESGDAGESDGFTLDAVGDAEEGDVVESYSVLVIYVGSRVGADVEDEEDEVVEGKEPPIDEDPLSEPEEGEDGGEGEVPNEKNGEDFTFSPIEPPEENDVTPKEEQADGGEDNAEEPKEDTETAVEDDGQAGVEEPAEEPEPGEPGEEENKEGEEGGEDTQTEGDQKPAEGDEEAPKEQSGEDFTFAPLEPQKENDDTPVKTNGEDGNAEEAPEEAVEKEGEEAIEDQNEDAGDPDEPNPGEEPEQDTPEEAENEPAEEVESNDNPEEAPEDGGESEKPDEEPVAPEATENEPGEETKTNENPEETPEEVEGGEEPQPDEPNEKTDENDPDGEQEGGEGDANPDEEAENYGEETEPIGEPEKSPEEKEEAESVDENPEEVAENEPVEETELEENPDDAPIGGEETEPEGNPEEDTGEAANNTEGENEVTPEVTGENADNETTTKCPPKPEEPEEKLIDKIDQRNAQNGDEEDTEQQLEVPLGVTESITFAPIEEGAETNTQDTQLNATVEIIAPNVGVTEMQIAANNSNAAVKKDEVQVAGVFQASRDRQGNG
ncbi:uncharacterized protein [Musca autumnalis]|uniref:uncharacterized protein n=1 Tax=Musca autumnalis TaxID=221902 RepID=UPI003CE750CB